jgi:hypothetical protein
VASGDGEQEMITEFSPQIQDSTEYERTTCRQRVSLIPREGKFPAGGFADCTPIAHGLWRADSETGSSKVVVDIA